MPTIAEVIERLFPEGTLRTRPGDRSHFPIWPPDAFALAATLLDRSGCYAEPCFTGGGAEVFFAPRSHEEYLDHVTAVAEGWAEGKRFGDLQALWDRLRRHDDRKLEDRGDEDRDWWSAAYELTMIADEACRGMGFSGAPNEKRVFADFLIDQHLKKTADPPETVDLIHLPFSLCRMVPPGEVCVQPKTATARVGCTLRSLSHHLALLPPIGEVKTTWMFNFRPPPAAVEEGGPRASAEGHQPLNLLAVPFPYRVGNLSFIEKATTIGGEQRGNPARFFDVKQGWLEQGSGPGARRLSAEKFAEFLERLIVEARREVSKVHGIILPELALENDLVFEVAEELAKVSDQYGLELFIAGYLGRSAGGSMPTNNVFCCRFLDGKPSPWTQKKHHRWRLTRDQIRRYHLGDSLSPNLNWWERIDISGRQCAFHVFRPRASLVALVCEDLARIDPVQSIIRSIGPNLVVALLMDGPQLGHRWSNRYATVLAEDPGSAVLTLTSLGFIRRSSPPGDDESRQIGLWKEIDGEARELKLPRGAHALLLTLSTASEEVFTLDGRTDHSSTVKLYLSGQHAIVADGCADWARSV